MTEPLDVRALPKVLLHDHLDGGVRPATMLDLAAEAGYSHLPARTAAHLAAAIVEQATGRGLVSYLSAFTHIRPLLQTYGALRRIASEAAQDLADDGVVYAELRFAPEAHTDAGLSIDGAVEAVLDGLADAVIPIGLIVTALRHGPNTMTAASTAVRWVDRGVVGFDLAGPEVGFPVRDHGAALAIVRPHLPLTIHAGEVAGPQAISDALDAGAARIGHGVALAQCLRDPRLAPGLLDRVLAARTTLEICPTSNLQVGIVTRLDEHPIDELRRAGVHVTINTDNRTLGNIGLSHEIEACTAVFGWDNETVSTLTQYAAAAAFCQVRAGHAAPAPEPSTMQRM